MRHQNQTGKSKGFSVFNASLINSFFLQVTGVVGRAETLSSLFYLLAFIMYTKSAKQKRTTGWRPLLLSMLFVSIAMLCKEQGITVAGVCFIYEIFVVHKVSGFFFFKGSRKEAFVRVFFISIHKSLLPTKTKELIYLVGY